jgi:SNF2 family DNA or RNA helicase
MAIDQKHKETKKYGNMVSICSLPPFEHQIKAFNKLYGKPYGALLAEMGTSKTRIAIDIASNLFLEGKIDRVLVVAPKGVHAQWFDEQVPLHSPVPWHGFVWESKSTKAYTWQKAKFLEEKSDVLKWFFVNIDVFSSENHLSTFKKYLKGGPSMVIVDEATTIKEPSANRSQNMVSELGARDGKDFFPFSEYRLILTGSLVNNSPFDVYQPFNFLKFDFFNRSFFSFKNRYGINKKETRVKGREFWRGLDKKEIQGIRNKASKGWSAEDISFSSGADLASVEYLLKNPEVSKPYKNLEELKLLIKPVSFIITKEECLDLPEETFETLRVDFSPEQKKIYEQTKKHLIAEYEGKVLTVANKLSLIGRLQQITAGYFPSQNLITNEEGEQAVEVKTDPIGKSNPKHTALLREFEEVNFDHPVLVWGRFTREIEDLEKLLLDKRKDLNVRTYYGQTSDDQRREIKKEFLEGEVDVLILNPAVGGMGLNLQRSHLAYYLTNSYSLDQRAQSEARIHRNGQIHPCTYKDIVIPYTIDERVLEVLKGKRILSEYFMDKEIKEFLS